MSGAALIFDCDGVLVDSEPLSVAELGRALRETGLAITDAQILDRMIGRPVGEIVALLADEQGIDATPALPAYRERLAARFRAELRPVPGIAAALDALPPLPRACASSSTPARLELMLRLTGLWDRFAPHIVSTTQVARGKPAPDVFLLAAEGLGAAPRDCIVIEDSVAGVIAARAAGMRVIGLTAASHAVVARLPERLAALHPDAMVADTADLPEVIGRMVGG